MVEYEKTHMRKSMKKDKRFVDNLNKIYERYGEKCDNLGNLLEENLQKDWWLNAYIFCANEGIASCKNKGSIEADPINALEYMIDGNRNRFLDCISPYMEKEELLEGFTMALGYFFRPYQGFGSYENRNELIRSMLIEIVYEIIHNTKKNKSERECMEIKEEYKNEKKKKIRIIKKIGSNSNIIYEEKVLESDDEEEMKTWIYFENYYSSAYQIGLCLHSDLRRILTKGRCRNKTFKKYYSEIQRFRNNILFSESYMLEKETGLLLSIELYQVTSSLMYLKDNNITEEIVKLVQNLSSIRNLEIRLIIAKGVSKLITTACLMEHCDIEKVLEAISRGVEEFAEDFNAIYSDVFRIMLYIINKKDRWIELSKKIETEMQTCMNFYNLQCYVKRLDKDKCENLLKKYEYGKLLESGPKTLEYKWFHTIFDNIEKGQEWIYNL